MEGVQGAHAMTPPVRPENTDPLEYLQYLRETGQREQAQEFTRYLTETGQFDAGTIARQMEYREGRLEKRMARANANDADRLEAESVPSYAQQALGGIASLAQDIPGAEALQAAARVYRSQRHGIPTTYADELGDINAAQDAPKLEIPYFPDIGPGSINRLAGGGIAAASLPIKSPALAGGAYGLALGASGADPDQSLLERGAKGVGSGLIGLGAGKAADVLGTGARALFAPNAAKNLAGRQASRSANAERLYGDALAQGQGKRATPELLAFLDEPDIKPIVARLSSMREFQGVAPDDPRMLDAIYKVLTDQAKVVSKGLGQTDPGKVNTGRFEGQSIEGAKRTLLDLLEQPGQLKTPAQVEIVPSPEVAQSPPPSLREALEAFRSRSAAAVSRNEGTVMQQQARQALERRSAEASVPPPMPFKEPGMRTVEIAPASTEILPPVMPGMRDAVQTFAKDSRGIEAVERGFDAMRNASSPGGTAAKNLTKKGPRALTDWLESQGDDLAEPASEGVLGYIKNRIADEPTAFINPATMLRQSPARNALFRGGRVLRGVEGTAAENAMDPLNGGTLIDFLNRLSTSAATPNIGQ
jgi:hypothetical protein